MSQFPALPPLSSLRAFEAAARQESFQRAADELFLTAGAVAHQVRQLEARTGLNLFHRHPRGISLTPVGHRYYETIRSVLDMLSSTTQLLQAETERENVITISSIASFITRWMMPRLVDFTRRYPAYEVRLQGITTPADLRREPVDVSIRLGNSPYPDLEVDTLFSEDFMAVASPAYAAEHKFDTAQDLLGVTLLHDSYEALLPDQVTWKMWLTKAGVKTPAKMPGFWFSHTYLTLEAAMAGQGVAIASAAMLGNALEIGSLVQVVPQTLVRGPYSYRLLRLPEAESRPAVQAFCAWIMEMVNAPPLQAGEVPMISTQEVSLEG
ncbi:transcriptional regulator GcvA [Pokkaliibacter sp. CJK22405]|uniref:transcriptional regulator GcvA n=1 Tax=Pokkaliibacter sp. CJK22405 TaxID=3384615 RepID=UPI003985512A